MSIGKGARVNGGQAAWRTSRYSALGGRGNACVQAGAASLWPDGAVTLEASPGGPTVLRPADRSGPGKRADAERRVAQARRFFDAGKVSAETYDHLILQATEIMISRHRAFPFRSEADPAKTRRDEILEDVRSAIAHQIFLDDGEVTGRAWELSEMLRDVHRTKRTSPHHAPGGTSRHLPGRTDADQIGDASRIGESRPQAHEAGTSRPPAWQSPQAGLSRHTLSNRRRQRPARTVTGRTAIPEEEEAPAQSTSRAAQDGGAAQLEPAPPVEPPPYVEEGPPPFERSSGRHRESMHPIRRLVREPDYNRRLAERHDWWNKDKFTNLLKALNEGARPRTDPAIDKEDLAEFSLRLNGIPDFIPALAGRWGLDARFVYRMSKRFDVDPTYLEPIGESLAEWYLAFAQPDTDRLSLVEDGYTAFAATSNKIQARREARYSPKELIHIAHSAGISIGVNEGDLSTLEKFLEYNHGSANGVVLPGDGSYLNAGTIRALADGWRRRVADSAATFLLQSAIHADRRNESAPDGHGDYIPAQVVNRVADVLLHSGEVHQDDPENMREGYRTATELARERRLWGQAETIWSRIAATTLLERLRTERQAAGGSGTAGAIKPEMIETLTATLRASEEFAALSNDPDFVATVISAASPGSQTILATAGSLVDQLFPRDGDAGSRSRRKQAEAIWLNASAKMLLEHVLTRRQAAGGSGTADDISQEMIKALARELRGNEDFRALKHGEDPVTAIDTASSPGLQIILATAESLIDQLTPQRSAPEQAEIERSRLAAETLLEHVRRERQAVGTIAREMIDTLADTLRASEEFPDLMNDEDFVTTITTASTPGAPIILATAESLVDQLSPRSGHRRRYHVSNRAADDASHSAGETSGTTRVGPTPHAGSSSSRRVVPAVERVPPPADRSPGGSTRPRPAGARPTMSGVPRTGGRRAGHPNAVTDSNGVRWTSSSSSNGNCVNVAVVWR
ncbi:hypothetical protein [Actinomadura sp. DC4]|uniref:hypothetical protein n=1 Tax=Actinomadura sp. DC4 TaxID=3055069 RepID=UPI0025B23E1C|nr:hypothetical protein [Actinomadura sp. DC4]MDN3357290.1 hypothetical protein [Actinomadura sp. DC4]